MGVILSLLPPVVLSVTSWGFKRKFLSKDFTKENEVKVTKWAISSSISTEEEGSGAKQDITTCNESGVERLTMTALLSKHAVIMDPCIFFFYSHLPEAQIYKCKNLTFKVLLR